MSAKQSNGLEEVLSKIATYPDDFKSTALRIHEAAMSVDESLCPRLWYGMPGYAKSKDGPVLIYFRKDKYITFGQTENANLHLDDTTKSSEVAWFFTEITDVGLEKMISITKSATE